MRLWHYELIPYLPKQQLVGQWRELNSIFVKEDKHILINYVYEYGKLDLYDYATLIINEMQKRNYKTNITNLCEYFDYALDFRGNIMMFYYDDKPFKNHHNEEYLKICCWNLYEKFIRGQSGFTDEAIDFIKKNIGV